LAVPNTRGVAAASSWLRSRPSSDSTSSSPAAEISRPGAGAGWLMASPCPVARTSTTPVRPPWRRTGRGSSFCSTACAASVAWPTKAISLRGEKKRTCRSSSGPAGGITKAVSPLFSSRASMRICCSSSLSASSTTPAGLPVKIVVVKASTW
jgi:hypothetical protein